MRKGSLIFGFGINDADYSVYSCTRIKGKIEVLWRCPIYQKWSNMVQRCYSESYHKRNPTYKDCTVCGEWRYFSNFRTWALSREWEDRDLDKDLLTVGCKLYSPDTCLFIPKCINNTLLINKKRSNELPVGVVRNGKKFVARGTSGDGKTQYLSTHIDKTSAHISYLENKASLLSGYIKKYSKEEDLCVALENRYNQIMYHILSKTELTEWLPPFKFAKECQ